MPLLAPARPRAALTAAAGALALGLAACGGGGDTNADPAAAVPAGAPLYVQATVRPSGELGDDTEAALEKILRTDDPGAKIEHALASGSGDSKLSFKDDVEPWLGDRAGLFFTSFSGRSPVGALVVASTDDGEAADALEKDAGEGARKRSYKDVDYWVKGDTARGVVGDYAVIGSERGLRTVVDTVDDDGAETIGDSAEYKKALEAVGGQGDALATAYVSTQGLLDALARSGGLPSQALGGLRQAIVGSGGSATVAKLGVDRDSIAIDSATLGAQQSSTSPAAGDGAAALEALPGDAWLGLGISSIGDRLRQGLQQVAQLGSLGGTDVAGQLDAMQRRLGISIDDDLLRWMGDGALFVRGTSVAQIGGALVIDSSDPKASRRAIARIGRAVRRISPDTRVAPLRGAKGVDAGLSISSGSSRVPILLAVAGDRFIAGVGRQAIEAAVSPSTKLGDSASFKQAAGALSGLEPLLFFDVAPVLSLADGLGAGSDPDFARVRSYLARFGALAAGSKREGDNEHGRLVVTLK